jgi:hypothetical protein
MFESDHSRRGGTHSHAIADVPRRPETPHFVTHLGDHTDGRHPRAGAVRQGLPAERHPISSRDSSGQMSGAQGNAAPCP